MASGLRIRVCLSRKMPGDGGLNATVIRCSSDTPASQRRDRISQHNVTVSGRLVLTMITCMLTTAYRARLEHGPVSGKHWQRAVQATCLWSRSSTA